MSDRNAGPLAGVKVVDLTTMVFGPYATQVMADMGADVIKVEPPETDQTRYISQGPERGLGGVFVNINRGKKSVMLDLRTDEGAGALRRLLKDADVFIHSMRRRAIGQLGFDYDAVSAINPGIVYTNCYGFGRRGPYADRPAYDDTMQAECGLTAVQEMLTGQASFVGTIMADKVSGLTALYATMMALFHKARTGEGQEVEVPMFESMAAFMLVEHANGQLFDPPTGPASYHRAVSPNRRPYRTRDGFIAALVYNDKQWRAFVDAVKPPWADDSLDRLEQRAARINEVYGLLAETFAQRTTREWLSLLQEHSIPAAPLNTPEDLLHDPHLEATGFFEEMQSAYGKVRFPGVPTWFSKTPGQVQGPCPRAGEHTREVLAQIENEDD